MKGEQRDEKNENQSPYEVDGEMMGTFGETGIWRGSDESSIFCDVFPTLPDFPCMSSTSSSSSTPALTKKFVSSSASSTSSASSAVMKSNAKLKQQGLRNIKCEVDALSSTDCMDVMENFGYMDLIEDGNDGWDPSSIFRNDDETSTENQIDQGSFKQEQQVEEKMGLDELGVMFFEWLKTNKEHICIEDMKNIKFKKATIECAFKRIGSSKEGKKQLLKLILEWVEQSQLQKKRSREEAEAKAKAKAVAATFNQVPCTNQEPNNNPNSNSNFMNFIPTPDPNACMWIPTDQSRIDPATMMPAVSAYNQHYPFVGGANVGAMNCQPYPPQMPQTEYQMLESGQSWPRSQFVLAPRYNSFPDQNGNFVPIAPQPVGPVYGEQYHSQVYNGTNCDRVNRLGASATKEARKKRMARKKRGSFHRHHPHQNQIQKINSPDQGKLGAENCTNGINSQSSPVNWLYWPGAPKLAQPPTMEAQSQQLDYCHMGYPAFPLVQPQSNRRLAQSDGGQQQLKKQGFKGEKNLKFLLQKVLKQSDVGSLGRIVLPKKEAETQLPQLNDRDGIQIVMEDIGTSKVWNLRYRFWPNNKSRMYVLENTGEFVKVNGLQEGDFIVIYSDIKCGKYLIRGVKVRQPAREKFEVKTTKKNHSNSETETDIPLRTPSELDGQ